MLTSIGGERKTMEWKEAQEKANQIGNWPPGITAEEKEQYRRYTATIIFNESHGSNVEYTKLLKDARHRIISEAIERKIINGEVKKMKRKDNERAMEQARAQFYFGE